MIEDHVADVQGPITNSIFFQIRKVQCLKKQTGQDPLYEVDGLISRAQDTVKKYCHCLALLTPIYYRQEL